MKLRDEEELILDILRQSEMYGTEIVVRLNGFLKKETVHICLERMEEDGLVEGLKKRYRATEKGWQTFLTRHTPFPEARTV